MSTREELIGFVDQYLEALGANDPARLPVAASVKFTENGQALPLGKGLWATATPVAVTRPHYVDVVDIAAGQIAYFGVVQEEDRPAILSLRLKVESRLITEVETLIARQPEEAGHPRVFSPEAMVTPPPIFSQTLAPSERAPRAEMIRIANLYFDGIVQSNGNIIPVLEECIRIENGVQTVLTSARGGEIGKLGVAAQVSSGLFRDIEAARDRRFPVVDEERGLVFVVFFFDHPGPVTAAAFTSRYRQPNSMMVAELFKIKNRQITGIEAVLNVFPYGMKSGWD